MLITRTFLSSYDGYIQLGRTSVVNENSVNEI